MDSNATTYHVFFDCNTLRGKNWLEGGIKELIAATDNNKVIEVKYYVPEVARDEWVARYRWLAVKQLEKIRAAKVVFNDMSIGKHSIKVPSEADLDAMGIAYLKKLGIKTLPTPYKAIDFKGLTTRAVRHLAPFEEALEYKDGKEPSDKGYKDGLIAQTIYQFSQKGVGSGEAVVVLSRDKRFIEYCKELSGDADELIIVGSVNQLQNDLELKIKGLSSALSEDAAKLFYKAKDNNSVFYKAKIREQIENFYGKYFPDAKSGAARLDVLPNPMTYIGSTPRLSGASDLEFGKQTVYIGETSFEGRAGVVLSWSTRVELRQEYTAQVYLAAITPSTMTVEHRVTFRVNWSTRLQADKTLTQPLFVGLEPSDEEKYYDQPLLVYTNGQGSSVLGDTGFGAVGFGSGFTPVKSALNLTPASGVLPVLPSLSKQPFPSTIFSLDSVYESSPSNQLLGLNSPGHFWDNPPPGRGVDG